MTRLQDHYENVLKAELMTEFAYKNAMEVPRLEKIVINMGVGEAADDSKKIESAVSDMTLIAGQKPIVTKAKGAVANFKLREGVDIGCKVTLRRDRMYEFLDRLINVALPRVRDFRGISSKSFDGSGNFALGLKEQIVFPEIDYDKVNQVRGMNVVICTTAKTDDEARALLKGFAMPFSIQELEEEKEKIAKRSEAEYQQQVSGESIKEVGESKVDKTENITGTDDLTESEGKNLNG